MPESVTDRDLQTFCSGCTGAAHDGGGSHRLQAQLAPLVAMHDAASLAHLYTAFDTEG